jgi:hypothetical protein
MCRESADTTWQGYVSARRRETRRYGLTTSGDGRGEHQAAGRFTGHAREVTRECWRREAERKWPALLRPAPAGGFPSRCPGGLIHRERKAKRTSCGGPHMKRGRTKAPSQGHGDRRVGLRVETIAPSGVGHDDERDLGDAPTQTTHQRANCYVCALRLLAIVNARNQTIH